MENLEEEMLEFIKEIQDGLQDRCKTADGTFDESKLSVWDLAIKTRCEELINKALE